MKRKLPFFIEIVIGTIFVCTGFFIIETEYYSSLFSAIGFGLLFASCIQLFKMYYYEMPANKEKFEKMQKERYINSIDERKAFLRMRAGSLVYQIMTFILLLTGFALSLLHTEIWIIIMIFCLFLFQTILGLLIYKHLEKKM